jgi:hypothetical protein
MHLPSAPAPHCVAAAACARFSLHTVRPLQCSPSLACRRSNAEEEGRAGGYRTGYVRVESLRAQRRAGGGSVRRMRRPEQQR